MKKIFVSYSVKDEKNAQKIIDVLKQINIDYRTDRLNNKTITGDEFSHILIVLSSNYIQGEDYSSCWKTIKNSPKCFLIVFKEDYNGIENVLTDAIVTKKNVISFNDDSSLNIIMESQLPYNQRHIINDINGLKQYVNNSQLVAIFNETSIQFSNQPSEPTATETTIINGNQYNFGDINGGTQNF